MAMNKLNKIKKFCCIVILFTITTVLHAQDSGWTVNPYDYQYDMTVYGQLTLGNAAVTDYSNYEVAAFVGDECRGVAEVVSQNGYTWLYIRVRSNQASGETVTFKMYDKQAGKAYALNETVEFTSQGMVGQPSAPTTFTRVAFTPGDVNDDGKINVADITAVLQIMAGTATGYRSEAADLNGDSKINVADITAILQIMAGN